MSTQFISVTEAARMLNVTGGRVRQMLLAGHLQGTKLGGATWMLKRQHVEKILEKRRGRVLTDA
jgi:excisionase family DNA binding protein